MRLIIDKIKLKFQKINKLKYCLGIILISLINTVSANRNIDCLTLHVINTPPIGYTNDQGQAVGVHWDYLTALEKTSGLCINKILLPYPRIWRSIENGQHDGGIIFKSHSRSPLVKYVAKIRSVKTIVVVAKTHSVNHYTGLKNLTIGKTRGTHLSQRFDNDEQLNLLEFKNYTQATQMLLHGRINAIAGSALVLTYQLNRVNALEKIDLKNRITLGEKEQWLQLSVHSKHLDKIPKLRRAIEQLKKNGSFDRIMTKYYGANWRVMNK